VRWVSSSFAIRSSDEVFVLALAPKAVGAILPLDKLRELYRGNEEEHGPQQAKAQYPEHEEETSPGDYLQNIPGGKSSKKILTRFFPDACVQAFQAFVPALLRALPPTCTL
jgi:hypothetical protein